MANPTEISTDKKEFKSSTDNQSINQEETDRETEIRKYKDLIADNIKLEWLMEVAEQHGKDEVDMVNEIYDIICDMICYKHKDIEIKETIYPWTTVKSQFLKLRYEHIADILNRIVDADLGIKRWIPTWYQHFIRQALQGRSKPRQDFTMTILNS